VLDPAGEELPQAASATVATIAAPATSARRRLSLPVGLGEFGHGEAGWLVMFVPSVEVDEAEEGWLFAAQCVDG
jgi:hypothetical protein